jgi:hypothetical protein
MMVAGQSRCRRARRAGPGGQFGECIAFAQIGRHGQRPTPGPSLRRRDLGKTRPMLSAWRVRPARRRHPVLSRIRSRCEPTARTLMYSWAAAICASVLPRATRG